MKNPKAFLLKKRLVWLGDLICLLTVFAASAQAAGTNDLGGQFRRWLAQPGDFRRIIYSIPGQEYKFVKTQKTLDGPMYYEIGRQGKSIYLHSLTNIGSAWAHWPNPDRIVGVAANGDAWLIFQNNLDHQQTVSIQSTTNSPDAYQTNDPAITASKEAELMQAKVGSLGFASIIPGTFKWLNDKDFEAEVANLSSQATENPHGRLKGSIILQDNLGRPTRLAFQNSFDPPAAKCFMDYSYENDLNPAWFPSKMEATATYQGKVMMLNTIYIDLVELGTLDDLALGFTPLHFLNVTNLADISVIYSSNGFYYTSSRYGVARIYRSDDPDRPQVFSHTLMRVIFLSVLALMAVGFIFIFRRRRDGSENTTK